MIGTDALFMPKIGMNTKLCSLKYTPKVVTARSENAASILLMLKFITAPTDCSTMDGMPIL